MAGAGYKLFNSGDVLTAAQVNTYLMEQTVMVFNDAAARTTALSGVLSEGMISYLKDTNATEVYNGSAWVGITGDGDITGVTAGTGISGGGTTGTVTITNDMATTITAKGDIVAGTGNATYDNLAVGNSGETLVADSSTTTGLRWQADWNVGKNKIINGDFKINQRNFTSNTTDGSYNFDRFLQLNSGGTVTVTPQVFTLGSAPVSGYEGTNFVRIVSASQATSTNYAALAQRIESVRTLAGQTITTSFWAKASTGTPNIGITFEQSFGSGGSPSAIVKTAATATAITSSWARYSFTVTLPSISGKTLGTTNDGSLNLLIFTSCGTGVTGYSTDVGLQNVTIDIWGVQVEAGSVATPFTTATGTLAGELAACQRYYYRRTANATNNYMALTEWGTGTGTSNAVLPFVLPVPMRIVPTVIEYSTSLRIHDGTGAIGGTPTLSLTTIYNGASVAYIGYQTTTTGITQYRPYQLQANNDATAYVGVSAEL